MTIQHGPLPPATAQPDDERNLARMPAPETNAAAPPLAVAATGTAAGYADPQ